MENENQTVQPAIEGKVNAHEAEKKMMREDAVEEQTIELLPCPFCGGEAYYSQSVNGNRMVYVGCSPCGVYFKAQRQEYGPTPTQLTKDIVAAWNARRDQPREDRLAEAEVVREGNVQITAIDNAAYDRLVEILLKESDRYCEYHDMTVDADEILLAIIADRNKAYEQINIFLKDDSAELTALRTENENLRKENELAMGGRENDT